MTNGTLADILASVEIARINLEYASADLAEQGGLDRWRGDSGHVAMILAQLGCVRASLAQAQDTLGSAAASVPARRRPVLVS
jgi:hypothetical protein